jgi:hypothetical protein
MPPVTAAATTIAAMNGQRRLRRAACGLSG